MPPSKKLPAEVIGNLSKWVEMGAPWPGDHGVASAGTRKGELQITDKDRAHWAFQPIRRPAGARWAAWPAARCSPHFCRAPAAAGAGPSCRGPECVSGHFRPPFPDFRSSSPPHIFSSLLTLGAFRVFPRSALLCRAAGARRPGPRSRSPGNSETIRVRSRGERPGRDSGPGPGSGASVRVCLRLSSPSPSPSLPLSHARRPRPSPRTHRSAGGRRAAGAPASKLLEKPPRPAGRAGTRSAGSGPAGRVNARAVRSPFKAPHSGYRHAGPGPWPGPGAAVALTGTAAERLCRRCLGTVTVTVH